MENFFPPKLRHLNGSYDDSSCSNEQISLDNVEIDTLINPIARFCSMATENYRFFFHMERHFGFPTSFMMETFVNTSYIKVYACS